MLSVRVDEMLSRREIEIFEDGSASEPGLFVTLADGRMRWTSLASSGCAVHVIDWALVRRIEAAPDAAGKRAVILAHFPNVWAAGRCLLHYGVATPEDEAAWRAPQPA